MDITALRRLLLRDTFHRRRAKAMGFPVSAVELELHDYGIRITAYFNEAVITKRFTMVVSREDFVAMSQEDMAREFDIGWQLFRHGAFDTGVLLHDGYTRDQIAEFERRAAEFDREHRTLLK
jgi:hypothetical protein